MSLNSSWAPDESSATITAESMWLQGGIIAGVAYGVVLTLYFMTFRVLSNHLRPRDPYFRRNLFFMSYSTIIFILGTFFIGSNSEFTQLAFVQQRNYPGGPSAYEENMFSIAADEVSNVSFTLANWLSDGLMVWRAWVIYKDCRFGPWVAAALPGLMFCASFALGMLWLIQISSPASSPFADAGSSINWTAPYLSTSISLNVVVTFLIVSRLLYHRHRISRVLGPGHASHYTSIAAMIVESASVYSGVALLFLIPFAVGSPIANTFLQVMGEVQFIAPLLIIYRVADGKGWSSSTSQRAFVPTSNTSHRMDRITDFRFATGTTSTTLGGISMGAIGEETKVDIEGGGMGGMGGLGMDMGGVEVEVEIVKSVETAAERQYGRERLRDGVAVGRGAGMGGRFGMEKGWRESKGTSEGEDEGGEEREGDV